MPSNSSSPRSTKPILQVVTTLSGRSISRVTRLPILEGTKMGFDCDYSAEASEWDMDDPMGKQIGSDKKLL